MARLRIVIIANARQDMIRPDEQTARRQVLVGVAYARLVEIVDIILAQTE